MRIVFPSILVKIALVLIPLSLLKILSASLSSETFSNFFILFNICLYLSAFIFSLPAISALRFYHHEDFEFITAFASKIFLYSLFLFLLATICLIIIDVVFSSRLIYYIFPVLLLSSGFGYFLFVSNIYRSNQYLYSLSFFHFFLLASICFIFYFKSPLLNAIQLITILGILYWLTSIILRLMLLKKHKFTLSLKSKAHMLNLKHNSLFIYAFPLAIVGLTNTLMASSNQLILKFFISNFELAGYISSYMIAEKIFFAIQSLIVFIFLPIIYKKYNELNTEAIGNIRKLSFLYFVVGFFICIFVFFNKSLLVSIVSSNLYIEFSWIIPLVGIGLIFLGSASILVEIYLIAKKSMIVMKIYFAGAVCNILLNLLLIPIFGIIGAVTATVISYIFIFVISVLNLKLVTNVNIAKIDLV